MNGSKVLMVYSSKTGNTEMVAKEIKKEAEACLKFPLTFCRIEDAPDPNDFDAVIIGFWIDRGRPERKSLEYIEKLHDKKAAFFSTLGASPDSVHGKKCLDTTRALFQSRGNLLIGEYLCQGKIDDKLIEVFKHVPKDHPMFYNEENKKLYAEAKSHPDEDDLKGAREVFRKIFRELKDALPMNV